MHKYKQTFKVTTHFGGVEVENEVEVVVSAESYEQAKKILFMGAKSAYITSTPISEILIG